MGHRKLEQMLASYHNADAVHRFLVRCLLSALMFPAGCVAMAAREAIR